MNIFEIDEKIKAAIEAGIDPETGELIDFSALEELQMAFEDKVKNTALYYINLMAEVKALEEQEKKFKERKTVLKNKAERIKNRLDVVLDGRDFKCTEVNISYRISLSTEITDVEAFENYAKRHKEFISAIEIKPDKTAIKQALLSGQKVKGCELVTKQNIQIK